MSSVGSIFKLAELFEARAAKGKVAPMRNFTSDDLHWLDESQRHYVRRMGKEVESSLNPPPFVADKKVWQRAKKVTKKYWKKYDEPYAVVLDVYKNMGGKIKKKKKKRSKNKVDDMNLALNPPFNKDRESDKARESREEHEQRSNQKEDEKLKAWRKRQAAIKYAAEVDSTNLTLTIRPILNKLLPTLKSSIRNIIAQGQAKNPDLSGDIAAGKTFYTTAHLKGGNWVVDPSTHIVAEGSFLTDPTVGPNIQKAIALFNAGAMRAIQQELNRVRSALTPAGADSITNHESNLDGFSFEV